MKQQLLTFLAFLLFAQCYAQNFVVNNYEVDIYINAEGYFDVVENYDITFDRHKHGIYRDIQTKYDVINFEDEEEKREIKISKIQVPNYRFEATNSYLRKVGGNLRIKIGDPNKTVIGAQHYEIKYRVARAFLHEPTTDRFYWNLKPTQWIAPFQDMKFRIHLPDNKSIDESDYEVYSGNFGITELSNEFIIEQADGVITGTAIDGFTSNYGQAITVLVNFPSGTVKEYKPLWPFWTRYGWTLVIASLFSGFYLLWRRYGKDDEVSTTMSYHPPGNLDPAMAGFLIDDSNDTTDLIALIPYWGHKGYIKMEEIEDKGWFSKGDTKITKLKNLPGDAPNYQKKIFNGLFSSSADEVLISSLKNSFYTTMGSAKTQLKAAAQQYYEPKARKVKNYSLATMLILMVLISPLALYLWGLIAGIAIFVSFLVLLFLNKYMIKKNRAGSEVLSELKGFKQFIKTAEENKLKMLLKESPAYFESTMGYALSFGAFTIWARKFNDLNVQPPDWYSTTSGRYTSMHNFSRSFNSSMTTARSNMVSSPSSSGSGGGSSGGGFGGGGGGSW